MAGVPEATFPDWAARFLALGYKVARADERESALAKKMRERKDGREYWKRVGTGHWRIFILFLPLRVRLESRDKRESAESTGKTFILV